MYVLNDLIGLECLRWRVRVWIKGYPNLVIANPLHYHFYLLKSMPHSDAAFLQAPGESHLMPMQDIGSLWVAQIWSQ